VLATSAARLLSWQGTAGATRCCIHLFRIVNQSVNYPRNHLLFPREYSNQIPVALSDLMPWTFAVLANADSTCSPSTQIDESPEKASVGA
jgi:hypothetical protein